MVFLVAAGAFNVASALASAGDIEVMMLMSFDSRWRSMLPELPPWPDELDESIIVQLPMAESALLYLKIESLEQLVALEDLW